jgi:hypothetical protein
MSKHTPGPWEVMNATDVFTRLGAECGDGRCADSKDGWQVADCSVGITFVGDEGQSLTLNECRANARLIAAAPDMLEALRLVDRDERVEYIGTGTYTITVDGRDLIAIRAAIAKAQGEQA